MATAELLPGTGSEPPTEAALGRPATWRRLRRELLRSKKGLAGATVVALVVLVAVFGPLISPYSPSEQQFEIANTGPSWSHPLGADELGRDVLTRIVHGARVSLTLAVVVVAISALIGTWLGALAGYLGGTVEALIMRTTDFMLVFPWLLLALLLITLLGAGLTSLVIALCAVSWLAYARVVRAETLQVREREFVQASRMIGSSSARTLFTHVLPNVAHTVIVLATLEVSAVIIAEAGLTYLGLGVQPPTPTWGAMIADGQGYLSQSPWIMLAPAGALMITVIGINLLGDWLRDVLDPSLRGS